MIYDVAIIGGGPAGYTAAERAAVEKLNVVLFESKAIGGVCLNEGCIPTKTLLYSAKLSDSFKNSAKYGIINEGNQSVDLAKVIFRKNKIVKKLTAGIRMRLNEHNVTIVTEEATIKTKGNNLFKINSGDETYEAKNILICTGSETIIPPIEGIKETDYWTSKEALDNKELPESLAIIGGGVIGIEFASFFNSLGVKVSVIEMMPEILGVMDKELSAMLRSEYEKKGISFYLNTKVTKTSNNGVTIENNGESQVINADKILVSVGRKPNTLNIGIENIKIELHKSGIKVNEYLQTSDPNIYACGDVTGFSLLAHTAVREAEVAINHILKKKDNMSYKAIPGVVYTNPEFAGVGKTEEELKTNKTDFSVLKLPMSYSGRFVAENEMGNGICKLIVDKEDKVIGCHMLGNPASELIVIAGMAIEKEYTVEEFQRIVFPHPTVGEIIHESLFVHPNKE